MPQPIDDKVVPEDKLAEGLEEDILPKEELKEGKDEEPAKVPFHQDPNVQLYIERQVAKRVGEGNAAWEERMAKLEGRLQQNQVQEPTKIGDWTPSSPEEAKAAKGIVQAAKQEMLEELRQNDERARSEQAAADEAFTDWLTELKVTGTLKSEEDQQAFAKLIVEYGVEDRQKAVNLWNKLQEHQALGERAGEEKGIKKAQEAKILSGRKGNEPGAQARSFKQRRAEEPNFDAILDRELSRLTNN